MLTFDGKAHHSVPTFTENNQWEALTLLPVNFVIQQPSWEHSPPFHSVFHTMLLSTFTYTTPPTLRAITQHKKRNKNSSPPGLKRDFENAYLCYWPSTLSRGWWCHVCTKLQLMLFSNYWEKKGRRTSTAIIGHASMNLQSLIIHSVLLEELFLVFLYIFREIPQNVYQVL